MDLTKIQNVIDTLKNDNKPFWVFAVFKMDELVDRWSIIVSAPWITEDNRQEMFGKIIDLLKENLELKDLVLIARLALMPKTEHLIQLILEKNSKEKIVDEKLNGNIVHEGYILECNPNLEWTEQPSLLEHF